MPSPRSDSLLFRSGRLHINSCIIQFLSDDLEGNLHLNCFSTAKPVQPKSPPFSQGSFSPSLTWIQTVNPATNCPLPQSPRPSHVYYLIPWYTSLHPESPHTPPTEKPTIQNHHDHLPPLPLPKIQHTFRSCPTAHETAASPNRDPIIPIQTPFYWGIYLLPPHKWYSATCVAEKGSDIVALEVTWRFYFSTAPAST